MIFDLLSELVDALSQLPQTEKNQFSIHAIRNKSDVPSEQSDRVSFGEMVSRIESTLKDTKDSLYLDEYFRLIDADGDGFISHADLESMTGELGSGCMSEKIFLEMADKISEEGTKLSKLEFIDIVRAYI